MKKNDNKKRLKKQIGDHVRNSFPGHTAEFCGQQSSAALAGRTFGFRVRDQRGKYRSNIVWVDSSYRGNITEEWVRRWVVDSNG